MFTACSKGFSQCCFFYWLLIWSSYKADQTDHVQIPGGFRNPQSLWCCLSFRKAEFITINKWHSDIEIFLEALFSCRGLGNCVKQRQMKKGMCALQGSSFAETTLQHYKTSRNLVQQGKVTAKSSASSTWTCTAHSAQVFHFKANHNLILKFSLLNYASYLIAWFIKNSFWYTFSACKKNNIN